MKTYSHTPAPWAVGSNGATAKIVDADGKAVCMLTPRREMWNGDLIAASPEMLKALSDILHEVTNDIAGLPRDELLDVLSTVQELSAAAITKATGQTP